MKLDEKWIRKHLPKEIRNGVKIMHICPKGSEHSIVNTGEEDLVMLTIVVKR